jgi:dolichol-phosphate mannosyltransferase
LAQSEPWIDFVIPVFNEGANIERAVREIFEKVPLRKQLLIVYDFEEDDTLPVVRGLTREFDGLVLLRNRLGRGVLNAIRSGIAAGDGDVVIVSMADLSDDIAMVPAMVNLIRSDGADVVFASRYMKGGKQFGGPLIKGFLSRLAGLSLYWLGFPVHDVTNAFRAYRREILSSLEIESTGGFEYSLELAAKAYAAGYRLAEVPATWRDRSAGASRFRLLSWLPRYLRWYVWALTHRPARA